ncbi:MAG: glycosyltransferase family 39 protein [Pirellulales bacterium]|nr:glycosyltransferase family 39 protein [Pirellulales bacterium]
MKLAVRHQVLILLVGLTVFFVNLGATRLWDQDEAYFARTAVEMHQRGEWVVPYFNGEPFAHKPPLMFWMMRVGFLMFGETEFAARFWSGVFGVATALITYHLGRRLFDADVGLWAAMAMGTTIMFDVVGRAATPDSFLVFFCTLALYLFARWENWQPSAPHVRREFEIEGRLSHAVFARCAKSTITWSQWIAIYAAMGLAVLTKGPIGILPAMVIGLYLLMRDPVGQLPPDVTWADHVVLFLRRFVPSRVLGTMWHMRPMTALLTVLVVAGPWYALVDVRTGGHFLREFFGVHNLGRFFSAMDNHNGPIWYYIPRILIGFFPWSIFGIPTAINLVRGYREVDRAGTPFSPPARFVACWIIVIVGFFSLASTKLPSYVLPAYPALALATAMLICRWLRQPTRVHRWWPRLSFGSLAVVGLVLTMAGPIMAKYLAAESTSKPFVTSELSAEMPLVAGLGAILFIGGGVCLTLWECRRFRLVAAGLSAIAVMFSLALLAGVAVKVDRHQPSPLIAENIRCLATREPSVAQYGYFRPSLVYYTNTRIESCKNPDQVANFLKGSSDAFLVTTEAHYAELYGKLPPETVVLCRYPEFPKHGMVLVLACKAALADGGRDAQR